MEGSKNFSWEVEVCDIVCSLGNILEEINHRESQILNEFKNFHYFSSKKKKKKYKHLQTTITFIKYVY